MSADDPIPRGPPVRFHTYADDSPWDEESLEEESWDETWSEPTEGPPPPPTEDRPSRRWLPLGIGGAAVAALVGVSLAVGLTDRGPDETTRPPMAVEVAARPSAPVVPAPTGEKLEVLPPDLPAPVPEALIAQSEPTPVLRAPPAGEAARAATTPPVQTPAAASVKGRDASAVGAEDPPAPPPPSPRARAERESFACADLPTPAMFMVCADRRLARLDQRMKRAYEAALAAGASPGRLRRDQEEWLDVREDAAAHSRAAVADIYRQRIEELEDLAFR
jgi:uncharacterized protein YecT (DUF1311 family)